MPYGSQKPDSTRSKRAFRLFPIILPTSAPPVSSSHALYLKTFCIKMYARSARNPRKIPVYPRACYWEPVPVSWQPKRSIPRAISKIPVNHWMSPSTARVFSRCCYPMVPKPTPAMVPSWSPTRGKWLPPAAMNCRPESRFPMIPSRSRYLPTASLACSCPTSRRRQR